MPRRSRTPGRSAHSTRSARNSCRWDSEIEPLFDTSEGVMTRKQYLARKQRADPKAQFSMYLGPPKDMRYSRRTCACGGEIKFTPDGLKAVCSNPRCSTVFNDGGNTEGMVLTTHIYPDGRKEAAPPPKKMWDRNTNKFFKAIKA